MPQPLRPLQPYESALAYFGAELRRHRMEHGLTQTKLGRLVYVSGDLIGKIEKAERRPSSDLIERLDACLEQDGSLAALIDTVHGDGGDAVIIGTSGNSDGSLIGNEVVRGLGQVLAGLRRVDHRFGSGAVLGSVIAQAGVAEQMLPLARAADRRELLALLAEFHQLAGWIYFDQGRLGSSDGAFRRARD